MQYYTCQHFEEGLCEGWKTQAGIRDNHCVLTMTTKTHREGRWCWCTRKSTCHHAIKPRTPERHWHRKCHFVNETISVYLIDHAPSKTGTQLSFNFPEVDDWRTHYF